MSNNSETVSKRRYLIYISEDAKPDYKVNKTSREETVMIFARTFAEVNCLRRRLESEYQ